MCNKVFFELPARAYFDQAQHMLRYAPHLFGNDVKDKQDCGWGLLSDRAIKPDIFRFKGFSKFG
jgi:hypothetical protein